MARPPPTSIYAPYEPGFLADAVTAIEAVMGEVRGLVKRAPIDQPEIDPAELVDAIGRSSRRGIGDAKRREVRLLILSGVPHARIVQQTGVSSGTVSAIRQEVKAAMVLYRTSDADICVPFACRDDETEGDPPSACGEWWARQDSNLRQHRYERRVLTN